EGVRRRFGAVIDDAQQLVILNQDEAHVCTAALNRSRLYVSGDSQTLGVSAIPHSMQFFDGDVIALALLYTGVGEIAQSEQDDDHRDPEFQKSAGLGRHLGRHRNPVKKPTRPPSEGQATTFVRINTYDSPLARRHPR